MAAIPGFFMPPLDRVLRIAGQSVHSQFLGGSPAAVGLSRYGVGLGSMPGLPGPDPTDWTDYLYSGYLPDARYLSGPGSALDFGDVIKAIRGWTFAAPNGYQGGYGPDGSYRQGTFSWTRAPWTPGSYFNPDGRGINYFVNDPDFDALVLAHVTGSVLPDGRYPLFSLHPYDFWPSVPAACAALATWKPWDVIVACVDGTGSFANGSATAGWWPVWVEAMRRAGRSNVRLLVTKVSDYFDQFSTGGARDYFKPVLTLTGLDSNSADQITYALRASATGNGGDTPEAQFEGLARSAQVADKLGWTGGVRGLLLFTDTNSATVFTRPWRDFGEGNPVRLTQRDDQLGVDAKPPRLGNHATSYDQPGLAPRVGAGRYL